MGEACAMREACALLLCALLGVLQFGIVQPVFTAGGAGHALFFNGTDADAASWRIPETAATRLTAGNMEFWLQLRDPYQTSHPIMVVSSYDSSVFPSYESLYELAFVYELELQRVYMYVQSFEAFCTENEWGTALTSLEWHHVSINFDVTQKTGQIYRNGVLRCSLTFPSISRPEMTPGQTVFGQWPTTFMGGYNKRRAFVGNIDELRVWRGTRTAAEIAFNMRARTDVNDPALEMVVSFDDPENYTGLDLGYKLADQYNNILEADSASGVGNLIFGARGLELGRTQDLTNKLDYETARTPTGPSKPTFVFSQIAMRSGNGHIIKMIKPLSDGSFPSVYIPLTFQRTTVSPNGPPTVWVLQSTTYLSLLYDPSSAFKVTHGNLHQILTNGEIGTQLQPPTSAGNQMSTDAAGTFTVVTAATEVALTSVQQLDRTNNWCGELNSGGLCPYGVIYKPVTNLWSQTSLEIENEFQFIAYSGTGDFRKQSLTNNPEVTNIATVKVFKEKITGLSSPVDQEFVIAEDTLSILTLASRDDAGGRRECRIMSLPTIGALYQLGFQAELLPLYKNLQQNATLLTQITAVPTVLANDRCAVVYKPIENLGGPASSTFFTYSFEAAQSTSSTGTAEVGRVTVEVEPANDAPNNDVNAQKAIICSNTSGFTFIDSADFCVLRTSVAESGVELYVKLNSFDVDNSPVQQIGDSLNVFRPYYQVRKFPALGTLYQQKNSYGDKGDPLVTLPVIEGFGYATKVLAGSSQRTTCDATFKCENPQLCQPQFCQSLAFHLTNIVGEPVEFPLLEDSAQFSVEALPKSAQALTGTNEYVELEFFHGLGETVYLHTVLIWEQANPGAVVKVLVADEYLGMATKWRTASLLPANPDAAERFDSRVYEPSVCPLPVKTSYLRIEVARKDANGATLRLPSFEAIRIEGSLGIPQGMVTFEDFQTNGVLRDYGRVVYAPVIGVHSTGIFDTFDFRTSDCEQWSPQDTQIAIVLDGPIVPSEFCKGFDNGANDPVCMTQWMNYSKSFGHTSNPRNVFMVDPTNVKHAYQDVYIQPDVDFMVEIPLTALVKDLFEIFGLFNGTTDFCAAKTTLSGRLFGQTGQALKNPATGVNYLPQFQTRFFKVVKLPRSGLVVIDQSQELIANGFTGNSEIEMLADCPTAAFDFSAKMMFGIRASSQYQGPSKLEVEEWIEVFPSTSYAGAYIFRIRQKLNLMCTMNATHLNYYDKYPDDTLFGFEQLGVGHIVPREAYNASGACDDCWCSNPQICDAPPVGSYQDEEGICTPCHELSQERIDAIQEDPFEFVFFQQVCEILFKDCDAGRYYDPKAFRASGDLALACPLCPRGTFNPASNRDETCWPCLAGTYFPVEGAARCLSCSESSLPSFSDFEGAFNCISCPRVCTTFNDRECETWEPFTVELNQTNEEAGRFITDCVCKPGYYDPDRRVGVPCIKCPDGGYCMGGLELPVPCGPGVFENKAITEIRDDWQWQCVVEDGGFWGAPNQSSTFWQCEQGSCRGGDVSGLEDAQCEKGYANRLCSQCAEGYFDIGGIICFKCPGGRYSLLATFFTLAALFLVFATWYLLAVTVSGNYDSIDVLLMYMQVLSTVQSFSINWPDSVAFTWMTQVFELVNFDVDFLRPTCMMEWGYTESFYLQMAFPVIMAFGAFMKWMYRMFCYACFFKRRHRHQSSIKRMFRWLMDISLDTFEENQRALELDLDQSMMMFLQFANINYNILVQKSFEIFQCETLEDGVQFLSAGPEVNCWRGAHYGMISIACLSLLVNVVGLPMSIFFIVHYARKNVIMHQPRFFRAFGWMYSRYEVEFVFWEVLMLMRRFLVGIIAVFIADQPYMQGALGILIIAFLSMAHFFARPFRTTTLDLLDSVALMSTVFYLIAGLLYQSEPRLNSAEQHFFFGSILNLETTLFLSVAVVVVYGVYLSINEIHDKHAKDAAVELIEDRLVEALEGVGLAYQMTAQEDRGAIQKMDLDAGMGSLGTLSRDAFLNRLRFLDPDMDESVIDILYNYVDEDGDGNVDYNEFRSEMWERRRVQRKRILRKQMPTMERFKAHLADQKVKFQSGFRRYTRLAFGNNVFFKEEYATKDKPLIILKRLRFLMKKKMKQQVEKYNLSLSGSLHNVITGRKLRHFVENTISDRTLIRYHQVDQWMSASLDDSSEIGVYATNDLIAFYRNLLGSMPFVLDWLATASEADRFAFRQVMDSLFACQAAVGNRGVYAQAFNADYVPTMAIWLKDCLTEQQMVFWEFCSAFVTETVNFKSLETSLENVIIRPDDDETTRNKLAILKPLTLNVDEDEDVVKENMKKRDSNSKRGSLKVVNNQKAGITFEFDEQENLASAAMPEKVQTELKDFKEVKIVGDPKVGKLVVAAGEMPEGVEKCKFQWYRVRVRPDGQSVMEKIGRVNMPHYTVTSADLGCKLRMVVRPYFPDGSAGNISTAITATAVTSN